MLLLEWQGLTERQLPFRLTPSQGRAHRVQSLSDNQARLSNSPTPAPSCLWSQSPTPTLHDLHLRSVACMLATLDTSNCPHRPWDSDPVLVSPLSPPPPPPPWLPPRPPPLQRGTRHLPSRPVVDGPAVVQAPPRPLPLPPLLPPLLPLSRRRRLSHPSSSSCSCSDMHSSSRGRNACRPPDSPVSEPPRKLTMQLRHHQRHHGDLPHLLLPRRRRQW